MIQACWLIALLSSYSLLGVAQQSAPATDSNQAPVSSHSLIPRTHDDRENAYRAEHRVTFNATVTDAHGVPATDLSEDDFTILDNGEPRKIATFRSLHGDAPSAYLHAILLLDSVNSTSRNIAYERRQMERFLGSNNGRLLYPMSVAVLSELGVDSSAPSQDGNALIAELERLSGKPHTVGCSEEASDESKANAGSAVIGSGGLPTPKLEAVTTRFGECENRRFRLSISQLNQLAQQQTDVPGRAILVWVGSGWPRLRGPEFRPDTPAMKRNFFNYLVDLSTALREGQITLDAVSSPELLDPADAMNAADARLEGVAVSEETVSTSSLALPVLARQTGGAVLERKDIAASIAACIGTGASYYALSFDSPPASKAGNYHSLGVRVDKSDLNVKAPAGYYALP